MDKADMRRYSSPFCCGHCKAMRQAAAALMLLMFLAQTCIAVSAHDTTLALPHPLHAGDVAWIEVHVGPIRRGQEIDVSTTSGRELGVISPFGVRYGQDAGTYTLPLPKDVIHNGRVSIRLTITDFGAPPRDVTTHEVHSVKLTITGGSR
jgi:hypothetical protein